MQIEVVWYWAGVEEMKNCLWKLEKSYTTGQITPNKRVPNEYAPAWQVVGPYLKIEDGNPWSSAAILARCGKGLNDLLTFISVNTNDNIKDDQYWTQYRIIYDLEITGELELAHNLTLQWLHKQAPEVWAKGMEALR